MSQGGHGDTSGLLAELVGQGARGALLCLINDAESAAACHAAGEGATVRLSLGGKSDGVPFGCSARVLSLTAGRFTLTGPMSAGNPGNIGPTALIEVEGGRVIVASRKIQALDQAIIRMSASNRPIARGDRAGAGGRGPGNAEFPASADRGQAAAWTLLKYTRLFVSEGGITRTQ